MSFDFPTFVADTKQALLNPSEYFRTMRSEGGLGEPMLKALLYGIVASLLTWVWDKLGIVGPGTGNAALPGSAYLFMPLSYVLGLFIFGVLLMIISALSNGITRFEACLRATAGIMAIQPLTAAVGFLYLNKYLGLLASLAVSLYGLALVWNAMVRALQCSRRGAAITCFIMGALSISGAIGTLYPFWK